MKPLMGLVLELLRYTVTILTILNYLYCYA